MSRQRDQGQPCTVWPTKLTQDRRGNDVIAVDEDNPITGLRAAFIPQNTAKAELPGQQQTVIYKMIVSADLPNVTAWSRVEWNGQLWDVHTPAEFHHGSRHVRHWSLMIRRRP